MQPLYQSKIEKVDKTNLILIYHLHHFQSKLSIKHFVFAKGFLLSEGIFSLAPLLTKSAKSLPWAENLNFPPILKVNNLFKFSAQASDLVPFVAYGTQDKIPSEIKPPLMKN